MSDTGFADGKDSAQCADNSYTVNAGILPAGQYTLTGTVTYGHCSERHDHPCPCDATQPECAAVGHCDYDGPFTACNAWEFCLECLGPDRIQFDKDTLSPDGEDSTIASVGVEPCSGKIKWRILGDDLGAKIVQDPNSLSATIIAGTRSGTILVEAVDGSEDGGVLINESTCFVRAPLEIGCAACAAGTCGPGKGEFGFAKAGAYSKHYECGVGEVETGDPFSGMRAAFNLGASEDGKLGGKLRIQAGLPHADLAKPRNLRFHLDREDVLVGHLPAGDGTPVVRYVRTSETLAWVDYALGVGHTIDDDDYFIEFYSKDQILDWENRAPSPTSEPFVVWAVEVTTSGLKITEQDGTGAAQAEYLFTSPGTSDWTLTVNDMGAAPDPGRVETEEWTSGQPGESIRTYTVTQDGGTWTEIEETYANHPAWGSGLVRRIVRNPDSTDLITNYTYHDDPAFFGLNSKALLRLQENPDGSWAAYDYHDVTGAPALAVYSYLDSPVPTQDPTSADAHSFEYLYWSQLAPADRDNDDGGSLFFLRPRMVIERITNTIVSKTYHAFKLDGGDLVRIQKRCINPDSDIYLTTSNLTTTTTYDLLDEDEIRSIEYPDGRLDTYAPPSFGDFVFDPVNPGNSSFSPDPNATDRLDAITHGTVADPDGVPFKTTQEVIITRGGSTLMAETFVYEGQDPQQQPLYTRIGWTVSEVDGLMRPLSVYGSDNTLVETTYDSCCSSDSTTDAAGTRMEYVTDELGRTHTSTKIGAGGPTPNITTTVTYDSLPNRRRVTTTIESIVSTNLEYDRGGRLVLNSDDANLVTNYVYTTGTGGGTVISVTYPDGTNKITENYRDGRPMSITGSAVVDQFYEYAVPAAGQTSVTVRLGSETSTRYVTTVYDAVGRVESEERSGWAADPNTTDVTTKYFYRDDGRLDHTEVWSQSQPLGPLYGWTLYVYNDDIDPNGLPVLERTVLDTNDNNQVDPAVDRITENASSYEQDASSDWWLKTTSGVFQGTDSSATITSTQRQRLTFAPGTKTAETQSEDIFGNVTTTTTVIDRGTKTVTGATDYPNSTGSATSVTVNGLLTSTTARAGQTTTFGYDSIGRRDTTTDPRGNDTTIQYDAATGRVASVTRVGTPSNYVTSYEYFGNSETPPLRNGKLKSVDNPGLNKTFYDYDSALGGALGGVTHVWGAAAQPIMVEYDAVYGQVAKLHTFQAGTDWNLPTWPMAPGPADVTEWEYDADTGSVNKKIYADLSEVGLSYLADGRIDVRTWARQISALPVTTDYDYDSNTAELTGITYSANSVTPNVSFTYDRLGRMETANDAVGTRTFTFDPATLNPLKEIINSAGNRQLYYREITREYEPDPVEEEAQGFVVGRPKKIQVGDSIDPAADYSTEYSYDVVNARLNRVSGPGLPGYGAVYNFNATSGLLDRIDFKSGVSTTVAKTLYTYEADRNLLKNVRNKWGATLISRYGYRHDALGRRDSIIRGGAAHATYGVKHHNAYGYNTRNELLDATRYDNTVHGDTSNPDASKNFDYTYDNAGNRATYMVAEQTAQTKNYCVNNLNQYATIDTEVVCPPSIPADEAFDYDPDGNMESDGTFSYQWDGENRLTDVTPTVPQNGDKRLLLKYDYRGRRVQKSVWQLVVSEWVEIERLKFVYDGWNVLLELEPDDLANPTEDVVVRKYTWGLDIGSAGVSPANGFQSAGGIRGLLAMHEPDAATPKNYIYFHDANGTVGQLMDVDNNGTIVAHYEYDPYGGVTVSAGTYASENPFRFSTKYWDDESGLGYWEYRYYSARLVRWLSRDPTDEFGGPNLYEFLSSSPLNSIDVLGLLPWAFVLDRILVCGNIYSIGKLRDESQAIVDRIRKQDPNDPRLLFLDIQQCILSRLACGACCTSSARAADWLNRLLRVFVGSLNHALNGRIATPGDSKTFLEFVNGKTGGPWWSVAFTNITAGLAKYNRGDSRWNSSPNPDEIAAVIMMKAHIQQDLRFALLLEGVGSNADYKCIGDIVEACTSKNGRMPDALSNAGLWLFPGIDPQELREKMRQMVKDGMSRLGKGPYQGGRAEIIDQLEVNTENEKEPGP